MTERERQLKTNYFSNSHLLHLIFQAPGPGGQPGLALPVDSLDGHLHCQPPRWKEIDDGLISKSWQLQLKKK